MNRLPRLLIAATTCTLACASVGNAQDSTDPLMETLTVTASLREASEMETAASVSVMDEALIKEAGQQHFESLAGGEGNFTMEFSHYAEVPALQLKELKAAAEQ